MEEVVEVMQMVLESLDEKGILYDYLKEHGVGFTEVQSSKKGQPSLQVLPLPLMNFSQEPSVSPVVT